MSLTLSVAVSLAAALGGCGSTTPITMDPETAPPARSGLPASTPTTGQPANGTPLTIAPPATPTPTATSATAESVKAPLVSTATGYRPEPVSSPVPSIAPETTPTPTMVPASPGTPPAGTEERPPSGTGYVLTTDQVNHEPVNSNTEPAPSSSGGIAENAGSASLPVQTDPVEGQAYNWQDGDRTLTVLLQPDLMVGEDGKIADLDEEEKEDTVVTRSSEGVTVVTRSIKGDTVKQGGRSADSEGQPVFRSESGELMTLPGGVLVALNPEWSQEETDAFFAGNGIKLNRVSDLGFIANGFFVETEPGFPSLNLANVLAGQEEVILSSPNWWTEVSRD